MTSPLLSLLAGAGLVLAGTNATVETRSAQALPAQNLAVSNMIVAPASGGPVSSKLHTANRLADSNQDQSSNGNCVFEKRLVDAMHPLCRKAGGGWGTPLAFGLGAAAVAGVIIAVSSNGNNSNGNGSVSH